MDMNAYCIAVFGVPLGQHGGEPRATPLDGETIEQTNTPLTDPWADNERGEDNG